MLLFISYLSPTDVFTRTISPLAFTEQIIACTFNFSLPPKGLSGFVLIETLLIFLKCHLHRLLQQSFPRFLWLGLRNFFQNENLHVASM